MHPAIVSRNPADIAVVQTLVKASGGNVVNCDLKEYCLDFPSAHFLMQHIHKQCSDSSFSNLRQHIQGQDMTHGPLIHLSQYKAENAFLFHSQPAYACRTRQITPKLSARKGNARRETDAIDGMQFLQVI